MTESHRYDVHSEGTSSMYNFDDNLHRTLHAFSAVHQDCSGTSGNSAFLSNYRRLALDSGLCVEYP